MELSQLLLAKYNYYLMWGCIYGGLFIFGVLLYLLLSGSAIHRAPLSVKENSLPIRLSMRTASEGPTVSSRRYPRSMRGNQPLFGSDVEARIQRGRGI